MPMRFEMLPSAVGLRCATAGKVSTVPARYASRGLMCCTQAATGTVGWGVICRGLLE